MRNEHELKCWPEFFRALLSGAKTFELRKDDRGFRVYDVLWLREWRRLRILDDGREEGEYTGREMRRTVTYVLSGLGLSPSFVCLGLAPDITHAPLVEQLEGWASALDAALLVPGDLGLRALRLMTRQTVDAMREVAADLARDETAE